MLSLLHLQGMKNLVIFASGEGTLAESFFRFYKGHPSIKISTVFCSHAGAAVVDKAKQHGIPVTMISKEMLMAGPTIFEQLGKYKPDYIILAGFIWLVPAGMIEKYPGKILNIHPSLLPKFGGKGMFGMRVHEAVLGAKEKESGFTIHLIDEHFDRGEVIYQERIPVYSGDTPIVLAARIGERERYMYPRVVEGCLE